MGMYADGGTILAWVRADQAREEAEKAKQELEKLKAEKTENSRPTVRRTELYYMTPEEYKKHKETQAENQRIEKIKTEKLLKDIEEIVSCQYQKKIEKELKKQAKLKEKIERKRR